MKTERWLLLRVLLGIVVGLGAGAVAAYGQAAEASLSFGAGLFTNKNIGDLSAVGGTAGEILKLSSGFRLSARLDFNAWRYLSHEIGYGYQRSSLDFGSLGGKTGMNVHHVYYDLLLHARPEGSAVRPFVAGGGGFSTFYPPGASVFSGNGSTKFGFNGGAGIKVRIKPTYGFRFDVRDYINAKPNPYALPGVSGLLQNVEATVGFSILF
jgi:hypothetical protein